MKTAIIFLAVVNLILCALNLNKSLIRHYLKYKFLNNLMVFDCSTTKSNKLDFTKTFVFDNYFVPVFDLENRNLQKAFETKSAHKGIVVNGECHQTQTFLEMCGAYGFFDSKNHWLLISKNTQNTINKLKNVKIHVNCDINLAVVSNDSTAIFDVYNLASDRGGKIKYTIIHNYNNYSNLQPKYYTRRNWRDITLIGSLMFKDFNGSLDDYLEERHFDVDTQWRYQARLFFICKDYYFKFDLNINYKKVQNELRIEDELFSNKSFDIALFPLKLFASKIDEIDYGRSTYKIRKSVIFRNPPSMISFVSILDPFSGVVWVCVLVVFVFTVGILKCVTFVEKREINKKIDSTWSYLVILCTSSFCQQGVPTVPNMMGGRIVVLFLLILCMIIYQFYSAGVVSNLLRSEKTIDDVRGLIENPIQIGWAYDPLTLEYFQTTSNYWDKKLFEEKMKPNEVTSNVQGMFRVRDDNYALYIENEYSYYLADKTFSLEQICDLHEVQIEDTQDVYASYIKGTPYKDALETCLQCLKETGILSREFRKWNPGKPECLIAQSTEAVDFSKFYPALVILAVGIVSSLIVLILEIIFKYFRKY